LHRISGRHKIAGEMRKYFGLLLLLSLVQTLPNAVAADPPGTKAPKKAAPKKTATRKTVTGCLDEEAGPQYVIRNPTDLSLLYKLEPNGFPADNFARFLGHKVELTGSEASADDTPVLRVQNIKDISEMCSAQ